MILSKRRTSVILCTALMLIEATTAHARHVTSEQCADHLKFSIQIAKESLPTCLADEKRMAIDPTTYAESDTAQQIHLIETGYYNFPLKVVKDKIVPIDLNKVADNTWNTFSTSLVGEMLPGLLARCPIDHAGLEELKKHLEPVTACFNRVRTKAHENKMKLAQSSLVKKAQKPRAVGTLHDDTVVEPAPAKSAQ